MTTEEAIYSKFEKLISNHPNLSFSDRECMLVSFQLANSALSGIQRENGDPFIYHGLAVACILLDELALMPSTVSALFLHEATREGNIPEKEIKQKFGADVWEIVNGLNKISQIDIKTTSLQVDNFRKLLVSLSPDPRVILIKLADRLEVMRSLSFFPKSKQGKKSTETLLLYAPLAHQLGLYNLKSELEDIALKYTEPDDYRSIVAKLATSAEERNKFIADFIRPIEKQLKQLGIGYEIKSRTKSVYSIWRKMQKQKVDFEGVFDVFAIRILLDSSLEDEKADCWKAYSIVTDLYTPQIQRLRDWITVPKSTGYESLHITVETPDKKTIEVQIRTRRMDEIAEQGVAAHWRYKGVTQMNNQMQSWLEKVHQLLVAPENLIGGDDDSFQNLTPDEIFVFTPSGDLRRLRVGATVLDFAFDIHTNIGMRCTGAMVNGKISTIREKLKTGDVVEIITSKNQAPKADWLNFVVTSKARTRIRQKIREEETKIANAGKEMLERRLKNWKIPLNDEVYNILIKHFKIKSITEVLSAIGSEKISFTEIKEVLNKTLYPEETLKETNNVVISTKSSKKDKAKKSASDYLIIDDKLSDLGYSLAKCCNPIYGDEIFGFVTVKEGIKIHRMTCPNALRLLEKYAYRVVKAQWADNRDTNSFQVLIKIIADDGVGVMNKVGDTIRNLGINIRSFNLTTNKGLLEIKVQAFVQSTRQLDMLVHHLQQIKEVEKVIRQTNG